MNRTFTDAEIQTNRKEAYALLNHLYKINPTKRFAVSKHFNEIGYWNNELQRWQILIGKLITGAWGQIPDILMGDQPLTDCTEWTEVKKEEIPA